MAPWKDLDNSAEVIAVFRRDMLIVFVDTLTARRAAEAEAVTVTVDVGIR